MSEQLPMFPEQTDDPYWEPPRSPVFEEVKLDLDVRNAKGYRERGTILHVGLKRDWLQELYEELLDAAVYCKTMLMSMRRDR